MPSDITEVSASVWPPYCGAERLSTAPDGTTQVRVCVKLCHGAGEAHADETGVFWYGG